MDRPRPLLYSLDPHEAIASLEKEADAGSVDAAVMLMKIFLSGHGVPKDHERARHWAMVVAKAKPQLLVDELLRCA
jgi:TPR repeat protein